MTRYTQEDLPGFENAMLEAEAAAKEANIDTEASLRRQRALAIRWFNYYKQAKKKKQQEELLRQYNRIASMRQRT